ncbi:hypothetical protein MAR_037654 [Mya arenaria]|uniref:Uncharacterized protein n=1 Tax=Mya arenaria TaxID=6604 RepID=A0ABY7FPJ3_MYAAR|nr:hypothetical protein MAR_037654 [Mya arenaria]
MADNQANGKRMSTWHPRQQKHQIQRYIEMNQHPILLKSGNISCLIETKDYSADEEHVNAVEDMRALVVPERDECSNISADSTIVPVPKVEPMFLKPEVHDNPQEHRTCRLTGTCHRNKASHRNVPSHRNMPQEQGVSQEHETGTRRLTGTYRLTGTCHRNKASHRNVPSHMNMPQEQGVSQEHETGTRRLTGT